ncbi:MAG TPA: AMP-binding protein, partial [Methylomirabilota bacterium]|nr:AMP-binding protein [Methylomirabilota bacterium]
MSRQAKYLRKLMDMHQRWQAYFSSDEERGVWADGYEHVEVGEAVETDGVRFAVVRVHSDGERFARKLVTQRRGRTLALGLQYDPTVHDAAAMTRLLAQYVTVLEAVVRAPETPLAQVAWVPAAQQQPILATWNATACPVDTACLHERIEAQVRRTPDAPAVSAGPQTLTYAGLNAAANQWARRLVAAGVGPDDRVALCLGRGVEAIVAVVAVWKAGGAYVPLEPSDPPARLQQLVAGSGARLVLSAGAAGWSPVPVVRWERPGAEEATSNLGPSSGPAHLAYVLYTSGSTGQPKGVMVTHAAVGNLVEALGRTVYGGTAPGCVSVNAPLSFDASV